MMKRLLLNLMCGAIVAAQGLAQTLAEYLGPFVESGAIAGAVTMVATKDSVLEVEAFGYADIAADKPMAPDTVFWIASQTKAITSAAVMILVDEGKVGLDDPVTKYIPQFKELWVVEEATSNRMTLARAPAPMTIRQMLSNTSGLPFCSHVELPHRDGLPLRSAVYAYALTPLKSNPGTKYEYANAGFNTCGYIIERVSGMPYETFMQQRLFNPLKMVDTTFWPTAGQLKRLAKAYRPNTDKTALEETLIEQLAYPLDDRTNRYPMPGGGLFATAADVAHFYQMLLNNGVFEGKRILSEEAVRAMTTKQTPPGVNTPYGFGMNIGEGHFGHGGALGTNATAYWKKGLISVWLVQHTGYLKNGKEAQNAFNAYVHKLPAQDVAP